MFDKSLKYSYAAQKKERHRLLRIVLVLLAVYCLYNSITTFFCSIWVLQNEAMQPGLRAGDRLFVISSALPSFFAEIKQSDRPFPFKRGAIVLIDTSLGGKRNWPAAVLDGIVRFFTAQQVNLFGNERHLYVKRLIALPGDEISMTNFVLRVRPAGSSYTLTEFELSERPYYPNIPNVPALWDESLPFSGNMDQIVLGPDECFVVSDDRGNTGDSRTWGPVLSDMVIGRAVLRFWPLTRIGRP
ncbi:MAG: signal peptidase I [Treponema sp.]|jgi:signal peptidase I|nr:signal peptidase I [Treponema sp.]